MYTVLAVGVRVRACMRDRRRGRFWCVCVLSGSSATKAHPADLFPQRHSNNTDMHTTLRGICTGKQLMWLLESLLCEYNKCVYFQVQNVFG